MVIKEPKRIEKYDLKRNVYGSCRCTVGDVYAIEIPKVFGKSVYEFKCPICGTNGMIFDASLNRIFSSRRNYTPRRRY